jgi:hypothetical protein
LPVGGAQLEDLGGAYWVTSSASPIVAYTSGTMS